MPVSYTHLDVYKRQVQDIIGTGKKNSPKFIKAIVKIINSNFNGIVGTEVDDARMRSIMLLLSNMPQLSLNSQFDLFIILKNLNIIQEQLKEKTEDTLQESDGRHRSCLLYTSRCV